MEAHRLTGWRGRGIFALAFLGLITILAACSPATPTLPPAIEPTARPEIEPPECPECPQTDCPQCPEPTTPEPAGAQIPYYEALWSASAHNESVSCETCHNETSKDPNEITTLAGQKIVLEGSEAACMNCHQGGASTITVDDAIIEAGVAGDDEISDNLGVIDIQNFAAATRMGAWAKGGYQYPGKPYEARYAHVEEYDSCADCHDSHTLEIKLEGCGQCHQGVDSADDLARIRGEVSRIDYDGDGNTQEGIVREIEGFQKSLLQAMQSYAENNGATMLYDPNQPPYYFIDADGNGELDESEMIESNLYNAWTARLLRAAYNYHFSMQDKGAFIHNGKYVLQLLYDSIEDLDERLVKKLTRDDPGHFSGSGEAWRHWDEGGEVPRDCARCHSAAGLPTYLTIGRDYPQPVANGMSCTTCHTNLKRHQRHAAQAVKFPGGTTLGIDADNNLCLNCHLGQASAASLEENLESLEADTVYEDLFLPDIHYYPAGSTLFGSEAGGAYQYAGMSYAERNPHVFEFSTCVHCHSGHGLEVDEEQCATCHGQRAGLDRTKPQHHASPLGCRDCHGMVEVEDIRGHKDYTIPVDHDGDGSSLEGLSQEVLTMHQALYAAIQAYSLESAGVKIVYDPHNAPHFFIDTNENGAAEPDETMPDNAYQAWTPRALRAAYNYHFASMDPGAYAHNGIYILQVLYDSLANIGGDVSGMVRP